MNCKSIFVKTISYFLDLKNNSSFLHLFNIDYSDYFIQNRTFIIDHKNY